MSPIGPTGGPRELQSTARGETPVHSTGHRIFHRLLLRAARARRLRAAPDGGEGFRGRQRRVSVRAVAVPRGLDRRRSLRACREPVRCDGACHRRPIQSAAALMSPSLAMFLGFIAITLWITWWAARRNTGSSAYFAAGRSLEAWQNGIAVA